MFDWIKDFQELQRKIDYQEFKIEEYELELKRWVEGDLAKVKITKDSHSSKLEEIIKEEKAELEHLLFKKQKFLDFINKFDDLESQILIKKYTQDMTLDQIANELGYSYQYIKNKHAGLRKILKFMDEKEIKNNEYSFKIF